jgi:hypothetical protein
VARPLVLHSRGPSFPAASQSQSKSFKVRLLGGWVTPTLRRHPAATGASGSPTVGGHFGVSGWQPCRASRNGDGLFFYCRSWS